MGGGGSNFFKFLKPQRTWLSLKLFISGILFVIMSTYAIYTGEIAT